MYFDDLYPFLESEEFNECPYVYQDAKIFLHGSCDLFAYTLHQLFGYKIFKIKNTDIHYFCIKNYCGKIAYIDVRGITTDKKKFFMEFDLENPKICECTKSMNVSEKWDNVGIDLAVAVICENFDYYKI